MTRSALKVGKYSTGMTSGEWIEMWRRNEPWWGLISRTDDVPLPMLIALPPLF